MFLIFDALKKELMDQYTDDIKNIEKNFTDIFTTAGLSETEINDLIRTDSNGIIIFNPDILTGKNPTNTNKIVTILNTPMPTNQAYKGTFIPYVLYGQSVYLQLEKQGLLPKLLADKSFQDRPKVGNSAANTFF